MLNFNLLIILGREVFARERNLPLFATLGDRGRTLAAQSAWGLFELLFGIFEFVHPGRVHQTEGPVPFETRFAIFHSDVKLLEILRVSEIERKRYGRVYFGYVDFTSLCAVIG